MQNHEQATLKEISCTAPVIAHCRGNLVLSTLCSRAHTQLKQATVKPMSLASALHCKQEWKAWDLLVWPWTVKALWAPYQSSTKQSPPSSLRPAKGKGLQDNPHPPVQFQGREEDWPSLYSSQGGSILIMLGEPEKM